jgi:prepilin-type N-terminal cleavage/methylation domain-containing protein
MEILMDRITDRGDKGILPIYFPRHQGSRKNSRAPSPLGPRESEPRAFSAGFTLLELLVVLVLISLAAALVVPRLPSTDNAALKGSARSTAALLRYLGERSTGSKILYRLHVNVSESSIKVTRKLPGG